MQSWLAREAAAKNPDGQISNANVICPGSCCGIIWADG